MYIYMYIYMHIYMYIYMYECIHPISAHTKIHSSYLLSPPPPPTFSPPPLYLSACTNSCAPFGAFLPIPTIKLPFIPAPSSSLQDSAMYRR